MWYAAQTRSNAEYRVSEVLSERQVLNFWPHTERLDSRKRTVRRPFFPGYVFFAADQLDNESRHQVISVPQVVRLVGIGDAPEAIPERQMFSVRRVAELEAKLNLKAQPVNAFHEGQKIVIRRGPLQGVEGYVAYLKNSVRLVVQVDMLGQATSVEVDAGWLEDARAI